MVEQNAEYQWCIRKRITCDMTRCWLTENIPCIMRIFAMKGFEEEFC